MITILKNMARPLIGWLAQYYPAVQKAKNNGLTIFVFHDVGSAENEFSGKHNLCTPAALFKKQIDWIEKNFKIIDPKILATDQTIEPGSAILTFDDGWHGTFETAFPILDAKKIPSVVFLNMAMIDGSDRLVSAVADFLGEKSTEFQSFALAHKIKPPFHLSLTPALLTEFVKQNGTSWQTEFAVFQGSFMTQEQLLFWDENPLVNYANHLFNHWNACSLTTDEFADQFNRNETALKKFKNYISLFAFPNGQPESCFVNEHVDYLQSFGSDRVFSAAGTINQERDAYLLDRVALTPWHNSKSLMSYAIARKILVQ